MGTKWKKRRKVGGGGEGRLVVSLFHGKEREREVHALMDSATPFSSSLLLSAAASVFGKSLSLSPSDVFGIVLLSHGLTYRSALCTYVRVAQKKRSPPVVQAYFPTFGN